MRIVVFGASGGTGRRVVERARASGHEVTAVTRAEADVVDGAAVARVSAGHDAIVSAIGHRRAGKGPFGRMLTPPDLMERATSNFIAAARAHRIARVFVVSLHGAGDSLARTRWLYRFLVTRTAIRHATTDSNRMEALLAQSGLDWLAARPVSLTDAKGRGIWTVRHDRISSFATIPRDDVAAFLIAQLAEAKRQDRTPSLTR